MYPFNNLGLTPSLTPPLTIALHLTPLLSATASLTHAYMEYVTTRAFLDKPPIKSRISCGILRSTEPSRPETHDSSSNQDAGTQRLSEAKEVVIPAWFTAFFNRGVHSVVGLNSITLAGALVNLCAFLPREAGRVRMWYAAGAAAGLAHYAFVPLVGGSVRALVMLCARETRGECEEVGTKKKAEEWLVEWVGWHIVRMGTVDVVAWVCLLIGAVGVLSERKGVVEV